MSFPSLDPQVPLPEGGQQELAKSIADLAKRVGILERRPINALFGALAKDLCPSGYLMTGSVTDITGAAITISKLASGKTLWALGGTVIGYNTSGTAQIRLAYGSVATGTYAIQTAAAVGTDNIVSALAYTNNTGVDLNNQSLRFQGLSNPTSVAGVSANTPWIAYFIF